MSDLSRTTVRIPPQLKKAAEMLAIENDVSFQDLFQDALETYLKKNSQRKAKKIVFQAKNLGIPLDDLSREDIYAD